MERPRIESPGRDQQLTGADIADRQRENQCAILKSVAERPLYGRIRRQQREQLLSGGFLRGREAPQLAMTEIVVGCYRYRC